MGDKDTLGVVRARRFELVDGKGRARVILAEGTEESVFMRFLDTTGRLKVFVGMGDAGAPNISLCHHDGVPSLTLVADKEGGVSIIGWSAYGNKSNQTFQVYLNPDGTTSHARFFGRDGRARAVFGMVNENGGAGCFDSNGKQIRL